VLAADPSVADGLVAVHLRPVPPYDAGPEAARLGATAMIDVSDGLLADLGHMAAASGVRLELRGGALAAGAELRQAAALLVARPGSARTEAAGSTAAMALGWVLTGGEDHALVAAFPPGTALPGRWRLIGQVLDGSGVTVDGAAWQGPGGWEHFG
jgi:thiamine-monophosphate kinase